MVWYFIGVYVITRALHDRLEIRDNECSKQVKYFFNSRREIWYLSVAMQYPLFIYTATKTELL